MLLLSFLKQSYSELDIILVDDGSPDNCPQICDEYVAKNDNIYCIHKPNGGLSSARNAGLDKITGDYVTFLKGEARYASLVKKSPEQAAKLFAGSKANAEEKLSNLIELNK